MPSSPQTPVASDVTDARPIALNGAKVEEGDTNGHTEGASTQPEDIKVEGAAEATADPEVSTSRVHAMRSHC